MKNRFVILSLLFPFFAMAQEVAVTERGDSVVLYANGTWDYYDNYISGGEEIPEIPLNDKAFNKPENAGKKINGANNFYQVWYNEKSWKRIPPGDLNPEADIALQFLHSDIYAMVIYEELEVPIEYLSNLAVENALNIASDIVVVMKEYRIVNGEKVICMRMDGTMQGMKISYMTYFFSGDDGSLQFHVFTGQKLVEKHIEEIEKLLNGLMVNLD